MITDKGAPSFISEDFRDHLLSERKMMPEIWSELLALKPIEGRKGIGTSIPLIGDDGHKFHMKIRKSTINKDNYSIILMYEDELKRKTILARYNGSNHSHTNALDQKRKVHGTHIHIITERYQNEARRVDGFAEEAKYSNYDEAYDAFIKDMNIVNPDKVTKRVDGIWE